MENLETKRKIVELATKPMQVGEHFFGDDRIDAREESNLSDFLKKLDFDLEQIKTLWFDYIKENPNYDSLIINCTGDLADPIYQKGVCIWWHGRKYEERFNTAIDSIGEIFRSLRAEGYSRNCILEEWNLDEKWSGFCTYRS